MTGNPNFIIGSKTAAQNRTGHSSRLSSSWKLFSLLLHPTIMLLLVFLLLLRAVSAVFDLINSQSSITLYVTDIFSNIRKDWIIKEKTAVYIENRLYLRWIEIISTTRLNLIYSHFFFLVSSWSITEYPRMIVSSLLKESENYAVTKGRCI